MNSLAKSIAVLASATVAATAFAQNETKPDAMALYAQHCAQCHGADFQGGNAQSLLDGIWLYGEGRGYIVRSTKYGLTEAGMPAYEETLSDDEINALADLITTTVKEKGVEKAPPPPTIQTQEYNIKVEQWVTGLESPWSIAFPDSETALITEKVGKLLVVKNGVVQTDPVANTPTVLAQSQGGLLDVAVDPAYSENGWVYLAFSDGIPAPEGGDKILAMTKIVRGKIVDNAWTDQQTVFEAPHETYLETKYHYGCRIVFDAAGHLYFGIGERGFADHAQDLTRPNGKIHRVWPDGRIPEDNPFVSTPDAIPSIFAYGNRNPQGLAYNTLDGRLWESEHGPMGGDELNVIGSGNNYGWPRITWGRDYSGKEVSDHSIEPGLTQPALYWRPSIAVCGIDFYNGDAFPRWQNTLLVGALRYEEVRVLRIDADRVQHQETILKNAGRVRTIKVGPDGAIYVITNSPNNVLRLTPISERSYE